MTRVLRWQSISEEDNHLLTDNSGDWLGVSVRGQNLEGHTHRYQALDETGGQVISLGRFHTLSKAKRRAEGYYQSQQLKKRRNPRPSFPKSFPEFVRQFKSEDDCFRYIIDSRWPDGFECANCPNDRAWGRTDKRALQCTVCNKVYSATAGTVMHRSKQPLCTWLWATYLVVTDKRGISAVQLQKQLGINRYETAFNMLHKLRAAMVNPERDKLRGAVEVDETYVGGVRPGKRGRGAEGKALVVGAVEMRDDKPTRVRLRKISSASGSNLMKFVTENVESSTEVITDGSLAYEGLYENGYVHRIQSTRMLGDDPDDVLPHFHRAISNLKTWLLGTHHGRVSEKHLQAYLNEFAFRYNRRGNLQAAFQTLLGIAPKVEGPTYKGLYTGTYQHRNPQRKVNRKVTA